MYVSYQVYKENIRKSLFSMFTKVKVLSQKNPQKYKNPGNIIPCKVLDFLLDIAEKKPSQQGLFQG